VVVAAIDRLMRPDDFSCFSIYDYFLKQRKLIWTPSSRLDVHEDSGFMEALVSGMMAGLDRRRILRNTQTAKEENRKRGRCANAKITLPQGVDFDFKTGQWSWGRALGHPNQNGIRPPGNDESERSLDCQRT
jgi:hypothetical protein